ncbi:hypothetical protein CNBJ2860 [Cryptococcus deneoformans B-3501A]|uniref:hypothetical protein n=1 Tax=Cryptococcus deneoformans (strain B-3501A) TaxID=283643 RepID=UPI000042EC76|nr:hypothetical protein CNBJ2860 [Cryptococcus neoformans var. neoformans B-3501A]EAL18363.1 hypothetical protein CNBJ2860 [Cryptococcus neoformans var. neoformans B-3501A]
MASTSTPASDFCSPVNRVFLPSFLFPPSSPHKPWSPPVAAQTLQWRTSMRYMYKSAKTSLVDGRREPRNGLKDASFSESFCQTHLYDLYQTFCVSYPGTSYSSNRGTKPTRPAGNITYCGESNCLFDRTTNKKLNNHIVASHVDLFVRLLEACTEGKILQAQAHTNCPGVRKYWEASLEIAITLQFLLPAHTAGKDSPRTVACRNVVMNQGWSLSNTNAILPRNCADSTGFLRPKAFQLTSFIIDDEDQIVSHKSKKNLKNGHLALYADRYCCRFTLYGDDEHESPRIFAHTEIEEFIRLNTKDGGSTAEASDFETLMKKAKNPKPQTLEGEAEKKAPATTVAQPDPLAPADKRADGKRKTRFSSLARSISPGINSNKISEPEPLSKARSIMSNRSSKVRVSLDVAEEEKDSALALHGASKKNEGNEKTPKAGKGEKLGTMEMKKAEWKTAGSDAAADSDESGIVLIGKTSTPMTRSTKTYGSRGSRSSSARRPMQSKPPLPPMESSDSELDTKPLPPPNSNRRTSLLQNRLKKDVDEKSKATPTIRAPTLKSRAKSLASSIAEGRAATPVSRGPTPATGGINEQLFGSDGGNRGKDGKKAGMTKSWRGKKDKVAEEALPVSIIAPIPEPSSTSRRALIKKRFPQQSSDEEEPSEAEPWTKAGRTSLQPQIRTKVKNRAPSLPPTTSDDEPLRERVNTMNFDCDSMAEDETKDPQKKLTKQTTSKSTVKAASIPRKKGDLAAPVSESESNLQPEEYRSQDSRHCQQNMVDLACSAPSFVTVKDITNRRRPKTKKIISRCEDEDDDEQVQELEEEYDEADVQTKKRGLRPIRGVLDKNNIKNQKQKQISEFKLDESDSQSNSDLRSDSDHPPTKKYKANSKSKTAAMAKSTKAEIKAQSKARKNRSRRMESSEDEESPTDNQASEPCPNVESNPESEQSEQDVKRGKKLTKGRKSSTAATASSMSTKTKAQVKEIKSSRRPYMFSKPLKKRKDMTESESEGKDEEDAEERPPLKKTKKAQPSTKRKRDERSGSEEEGRASQPSSKLAKVIREGRGKTMIQGKAEKKVEEAAVEEEPPKISDAMRKRVNTRSRLR